MIYYKKKIQQDVGATAVEYGILSALIAVVTILGLQATGTNLGTTYCTIANKLSQAVGAGATASGCSSSSVNSETATSAVSSGTESPAPATSAVSSGTESPAPASTEYNAKDDFTAGSTLGVDNMATFINYNVQSMTGIYDADGTEITNPLQFAKTLGVNDEDYQTYVNALNGTNYTDQQNAQNKIKSDIANNPSANIYIPDVSKVTLTGGYTNQTATYAYSDSSAPAYIYDNGTGTFKPILFLDKPTGK